jgi:hypothetical protein
MTRVATLMGVILSEMEIYWDNFPFLEGDMGSGDGERGDAGCLRLRVEGGDGAQALHVILAKCARVLGDLSSQLSRDRQTSSRCKSWATQSQWTGCWHSMQNEVSWLSSPSRKGRRHT